MSTETSHNQNFFPKLKKSIISCNRSPSLSLWSQGVLEWLTLHFAVMSLATCRCSPLNLLHASGWFKPYLTHVNTSSWDSQFLYIVLCKYVFPIIGLILGVSYSLLASSELLPLGTTKVKNPVQEALLHLSLFQIL